MHLHILHTYMNTYIIMIIIINYMLIKNNMKE